MSNNPKNFSKYPNNEVARMLENVEFFATDPESHLKKIEIILTETISGFENLDQFEKYLDSEFIKISCEECQFSLTQIQGIDLNKPEDITHLISIRDNLISLRKLILIKIGELLD